LCVFVRALGENRWVGGGEHTHIHKGRGLRGRERLDVYVCVQAPRARVRVPNTAGEPTPSSYLKLAVFNREGEHVGHERICLAGYLLPIESQPKGLQHIAPT
jgi:hypothetical protein